MNVLLVGGGGREAALAWRLARSPRLGDLWCTHENPGFPASARRLPAGDVVEQARAAAVDLAVVGPEAPLVDGLADALRARGIPTFGPSARAARLEGSKGFAKDFMVRHGIPTAAYGRYAARAAALGAIRGPCVVKADGLAAGKGVFVCEDVVAAREAVERVFSEGIGGGVVVIEELLEGEELSVLAICDGERFALLPAAQDHKRRFDGDRGPNTGGMGAYAPAPLGGPELLARVGEEVFRPALAGLADEGTPFVGVLYAGLMVGPAGPRVLEFNVRFGDPECQPLMVLFDDDLVEWLHGAATGRLPRRPIRVRPGAACCVVVCEQGYPGEVRRGAPIHGLDALPEEVVVFHAATSLRDGRLVANGGRVLGVTAWGSDLRSAHDRAYAALGGIGFEGAAWRADIAIRGLA